MNASIPSTRRGDLLVPACAVFVACAAALILGAAGWHEAGIRLVLRTAARGSFLLFLAIFCASPLHALYRDRVGPAGQRPVGLRLSRWLLARRRALGLCFAVTHSAVGAAILAFRGLYPASFYALTYPLQRIGGALGFLAILLMVITSFDGPRRRLTPRAWKVLHTVCLYFLCVNFLVSFGRRTLLHRDPFYAPFLLALLAALALRAAVWIGCAVYPRLRQKQELWPQRPQEQEI